MFADRSPRQESLTAGVLSPTEVFHPDRPQNLLIEGGFPTFSRSDRAPRTTEHPDRLGGGAWTPSPRARPDPARPLIARVSLRPRRSITFSRRGSRRSKGNGRSVSSRISGSGGAASMESSPAISTAAFSRMASPASVAPAAARTCWWPSHARAEGFAPRAEQSARQRRRTACARMCSNRSVMPSGGSPSRKCCARTFSVIASC
jgi:hypothetical protein